jgi:Phosphotransferase system cellobiose-specific component IIC
LLRCPWLSILCQLRFIQFQMAHQVFFTPLSELGVAYEL